jgi:hypothetical protein
MTLPGNCDRINVGFEGLTGLVGSNAGLGLVVSGS